MPVRSDFCARPRRGRGAEGRDIGACSENVVRFHHRYRFGRSAVPRGFNRAASFAEVERSGHDHRRRFRKMPFIIGGIPVNRWIDIPSARQRHRPDLGITRVMVGVAIRRLPIYRGQTDEIGSLGISRSNSKAIHPADGIAPASAPSQTLRVSDPAAGRTRRGRLSVICLGCGPPSSTGPVASMFRGTMGESFVPASSQCCRIACHA